MKCPYLLNNSKGIQNPQRAHHLENMYRDECIEDECIHIKSCWDEPKPKKDIVEETFDGDNKNG